MPDSASQAASHLTDTVGVGIVLSAAPVHVDAAPNSRQPKKRSGSGRGTGDSCGELRPGGRRGVVCVQVVEVSCRNLPQRAAACNP